MIPSKSKRLNGAEAALSQRQMRSRYWSAVRECLTRFHQFTKSEARAKATALRKRLEAPDSTTTDSLIYHVEPYFVACDIAGIRDARAQSDRLERDQSSYDQLVKA